MIRIFLAGSAQFSLFPFDALRKCRDFKIVGVLTTPDKPHGRGRKIEPGRVAQFAQKYKLPLFQPANLKEFTKTLANLKPDICFLTAYGKIVPDELLKIPKKGWVNLHPSFLPKLRGPNPIGWAILKGSGAGLSLIKMTPEVDAGDLLFQEKIKIIKGETAGEVSQRLSQRGAQLIPGLLKKYFKGQLKPKIQKGKGSYAPKFKKEEARIDFKGSLQFLDKKIRAFNPWPKAYLEISGKRVILLKSSYQAKTKKLFIRQLQVEGKKPITGSQFIRGYSHWLTKFPSSVTFK